MTKYAEIEFTITNTVNVNCFSCKHMGGMSANSSGTNIHCPYKSNCLLNNYRHWDYGGIGTVKKVYET